MFLAGFGRKCLFLLVFIAFGLSLHAQSQIKYESKPVARNVPLNITIQAIDAKTGKVQKNYNKQVWIEGLFQEQETKKGDKTVKEFVAVKLKASFKEGSLTFSDTQIRDVPVMVSEVEDKKGEPIKNNSFSPWLTILPPLIAILLAVLTKEVITSLFFGVWVGVFILTMNVTLAPTHSLLTVFDTYLVDTLANTNKGYTHVIVFSLTIGGMIGIIAKSGGIHDLVKKISNWATTPRSGMISTWIMGMVIFFDDYANTLLVGNSMRPISDKLRISREKLAYIVDATAAPVCSLVLISTWIGTELGYIGDALEPHGKKGEAYAFFMASIPYHFYSIFTIVFVFLVGWTMKDYGAMYRAEKRTRETGEVMGPDAVPLTSDEEIKIEAPDKSHWTSAIIPIFSVIFITIFGLYYHGLQAFGPNDSPSVTDVIQKADSYLVLLWASFWGSAIAGVMAIAQRIMGLFDVVKSWVAGVKSMIMAMMVLILAWSLKGVCDGVHTDKFIYYYTKDLLSAQMLPCIAFIMSAVVAFATGTSWGTMGLIFPLIMPLAIGLSAGQLNLGVDANNYVLLGAMGSILAGASFGDHCSPISDTTVMSSMACGCDHIDHVKTQAPYALTVGVIACVLGYIPIGFGFPVWLCLLLGIAAMYAVISHFGKDAGAGAEKSS